MLYTQVKDCHINTILNDQSIGPSIDGTLTVVLNDKQIEKYPGQDIFIDVKDKHRACNFSDKMLHLLKYKLVAILEKMIL